MNILESFDATKYYLGVLCKREHRWNGGDFSLRVTKNRSCYECCKCSSNKWKQLNKLHVAEYGKQNWKKYAAQRTSEYYKDYYRRNPEKFKVSKAKYKTKNLDKVLEAGRRYSRSTWKEFYYRHKSKISIYRRQRRVKKLSLKTLPYSPSDLNRRLNEIFDGRCAYCQSEITGSLKLHWDHLVPIAKNGEDSLKNLVPACHHCNCQKWAHDAYDWYSRQKFFSAEQWRLICEACRD